MKEYLIVYHYADRHGARIGNVNFKIDGKITIQTVRELEKRLNTDYLGNEGNAVIINIIKLEREEVK